MQVRDLCGDPSDAGTAHIRKILPVRQPSVPRKFVVQQGELMRRSGLAKSVDPLSRGPLKSSTLRETVSTATNGDRSSEALDAVRICSQSTARIHIAIMCCFIRHMPPEGAQGFLPVVLLAHEQGLPYSEIAVLKPWARKRPAAGGAEGNIITRRVSLPADEGEQRCLIEDFLFRLFCCNFEHVGRA